MLRSFAGETAAMRQEMCDCEKKKNSKRVSRISITEETLNNENFDEF
jgi:hypothetical protein